MASCWFRSLALLVAVAVLVGCAAPRPAPPAAGAPDDSPATVDAAPRQACEVFAQAEAERAAAAIASKAGEYAQEGAQIGYLGYGTPAAILGLALIVPAALVGAVIGAAQTQRERTRARTTAYATWMEACLKPLVLAKQVGPGHPEVAAALLPVAGAYDRQGQRDRAGTLLQQVREILEGAGAAEDPRVLDLWQALAGAYAERQDGDQAEAALRRNLDGLEARLGPDDLELARALDAGAGLLLRLDRQPAGDTLTARAAAIRQQVALTPDGWTFTTGPPGTTTESATFVFTNRAARPRQVRVRVAPDDVFLLVRDGCQEPVAADGGTCQAEVAARRPQAGFVRGTVEFEVQHVGILRATVESW